MLPLQNIFSKIETQLLRFSRIAQPPLNEHPLILNNFFFFCFATQWSSPNLATLAKVVCLLLLLLLLLCCVHSLQPGFIASELVLRCCCCYCHCGDLRIYLVHCLANLLLSNRSPFSFNWRMARLFFALFSLHPLMLYGNKLNIVWGFPECRELNGNYLNDLIWWKSLHYLVRKWNSWRRRRRWCVNKCGNDSVQW